MRVLVTGSDGFIGKNLILRFNELNISYEVFTKDNKIEELHHLIQKSDFIIHLAGVNRPNNDSDYDQVNAGLTSIICDEVTSSGKSIPIILASSTQAEQDNLYGKSKLAAEMAIKDLEKNTGNLSYIYRLPGVFGKWCKPNYNSVVATFCHNIMNDIPIVVNDPSHNLKLVYIDDVIEEFTNIIKGKIDHKKDLSVSPEYTIKLGDLAEQIKIFKESRKSLIIERVGKGLVRKLYSTYLSYSPPEKFSYPIETNGDERGMFAEMLKTKDSGQVSFFTAKPGITRGGHYHHSKNEKFLVLQGEAKFRFRNLISDQKYEVLTSGKKLEIVETAPGWAHDITNISNQEMIVMLWANEIFNPEEADTYTSEL